MRLHNGFTAHMLPCTHVNRSACVTECRCLLYQAGGVFAAKPVIHKLLHELLNFLSFLASEQNMHFGERLFRKKKHHGPFAFSVFLTTFGALC